MPGTAQNPSERGALLKPWHKGQREHRDKERRLGRSRAEPVTCYDWAVTVTSGPARVLLPGKPERPVFRREAAGGVGGTVEAALAVALPADRHGDAGRGRRLSAGRRARTTSGAGRRACASARADAEALSARGSAVSPSAARGGWCAMEAGAAAGGAAGGERDGPRERRGLGEGARQQPNHQLPPRTAAERFPKQSYWLDLWLFFLVDLVLFFFVYLWPW